MSKYIDADKLHTQGWVAARYINWKPTPLNDNFRLEVEVKPFITFRAADVVEVVRCRECVMWDGSFTLNGQKKCLNMTFCTDGDFYCGWGTKE